MHRNKDIRPTFAFLTVFAVVACAAGSCFPADALAQPAGEPVVYLNQAWSPADREWYYHFSQGSVALSYDIFMNLEVADSQEPFRSDANSERYGLIPDASNPQNNPDGLPVGLSKTVISDPKWKGEETGAFVGFTCAACHEGQLNYKGKHVRIEGGVGNTFDFMAYTYALVEALQATLNDAAKFDRLAARLGPSNADAKGKLRARFESEAAIVHEYRTRNLVTPVAGGPGRLDAIALIVNRLTSAQPGIPENWSTPLAPTKPPFLWNTPQGLWSQWRATQGGAPGSPKMAGRGVRADRPRQSPAGQGAVYDIMRGVPQRVALRVDRTEQVRQALRAGRAGGSVICRH
jgi:hypothetical protein